MTIYLKLNYSNFIMEYRLIFKLLFIGKSLMNNVYHVKNTEGSFDITCEGLILDKKNK